MRAIVWSVLVLLVAATAAAQEVKPPKFVGVRVGFEDRYKVGVWTPVDVTLRGGSRLLSGQISLSVADGDGVPYSVSRPWQAAPGEESTARLYVRFGRTDPTIDARFAADGRVWAQKRFTNSLTADETHFLESLETYDELFLVVGPTSLPIEDAAATGNQFQQRRRVTARVTRLGHLPTRWYGYEGVEAVILAASAPELFANLAAGDARLEALDQWVHMGGTLLLSGGAQADAVFAPGAPLARFVPGRFRQVVTLRDARALENYSGSKVPVASGAETGDFRVALIDKVQGVVEASESDAAPLVVRARRGLGQIVLLATDLDRPPLANWSDRKLLLAKLLALPDTPADPDQSAALANYGYQDHAGQLRSALDRFTDVKLVPFWVVASLVLLYILCIGPLDYFLVRKVLRRMQLTWVTFPLIVAIFCVAAYFLAHALKGDQLRINHAEVIDIDASTGLVRGTAWMNVFSPRTNTYDLSYRPALPSASQVRQPSVVLAWMGLPGGALGGMGAPDSSPVLWQREYAIAPDQGRMMGVPVQVWSTKAFTARWHGKTDAPLQIEDLREANGTLHGTLENTLDAPLQNAVLIYRRWAFDLQKQAQGELKPGQTLEIGLQTPRSELRTYLTNRQFIVVEDNNPIPTTPTYDTGSIDKADILRKMSFYQAAGGLQYTRLLNVYQGFVDLSGLLRTDSAILLAELPAARSQLLNAGQPLATAGDLTTTILRVVVPVRPEGGDSTQP